MTEVAETDTNRTTLRIYEQTLTDGSKVYGVVAGSVTFDCATEAQAEELADQLFKLSLNTEVSFARDFRAA